MGRPVPNYKGLREWAHAEQFDQGEEGKESSLREWQKQGSDVFKNCITKAFKYINKEWSDEPRYLSKFCYSYFISPTFFFPGV